MPQVRALLRAPVNRAIIRGPRLAAVAVRARLLRPWSAVAQREFLAPEGAGQIKQGNAMKKIIAVATLVVAIAAAPIAPVQAASAYPANCLVLPLLQSECREIIRENVGDAVSATTTVASVTMSEVKRPKVPGAAWWTCKPAPAGTKGILACEY